MKAFVLGVLCFPTISVAAVDVCSDVDADRNFLSSWVAAGREWDVLSWMEGKQLVPFMGTVVSRADLNGDGMGDYIFHARFGHGKGIDTTFSFLIQCNGYLVDVGGDYFADVKVLSKRRHGFKTIMAYSYKLNKSGQVEYERGKEVTTSHVWGFNPVSKKYERRWE